MGMAHTPPAADCISSECLHMPNPVPPHFVYLTPPFWSNSHHGGNIHATFFRVTKTQPLHWGGYPPQVRPSTRDREVT